MAKTKFMELLEAAALEAAVPSMEAVIRAVTYSRLIDCKSTEMYKRVVDVAGNFDPAGFLSKVADHITLNSFVAVHNDPNVSCRDGTHYSLLLISKENILTSITNVNGVKQNVIFISLETMTQDTPPGATRHGTEVHAGWTRVTIQGYGDSMQITQDVNKYILSEMQPLI